MSNETYTETNNVLETGKLPVGTITVQPATEEVLELTAEQVAAFKAAFSKE